MIGIIGVGAMGSGLVSTLLREAFEVKAFDIDAAKMSAAVSIGAVQAKSIPELVETCDPIILSLPKSAVTVEVLEQSILPCVREGQTVIDAGTTVAAETRRLCGEFAKKGSALIDAPVSGGPIGSSTGNLFIFVGGAREIAERQWPLLAKLGGARLTYCGPSGAGQITKAVNQLAMGLTQAALIESIGFGVNAGVDAQTLLDAVGGTGGFRGQFSQTAEKIVNNEGDTMDAKYAEFKYFLNESKGVGFPMPLLENLHGWMSRFPESALDNRGRPFPPLWSSLTSRKED